MDFDDLKELGGGILVIVALFVVLGAAIYLAMKLDDDIPTSENKHVPLDTGVIYEKYEIPAHRETPQNHNGYLFYDDAYVISYQKTVDGELKQDQWYVDKETYDKYEVGDEFVYDEEHCSSYCSWTRVGGSSYYYHSYSYYPYSYCMLDW